MISCTLRAGFALDLLVELDEGPPEAGRQRLADGALAGATQADEGRCAGLRAEAAGWNSENSFSRDVGEPGRGLLAQELDDQGEVARQQLVLGEEVGDGLVEGPRDLAEHHHRDIALGAFEARQVRQRDARLLGQVLARHAALAAEKADVARQGGEQAGRLVVEAGRCRFVLLLVLRRCHAVACRV